MADAPLRPFSFSLPPCSSPNGRVLSWADRLLTTAPAAAAASAASAGLGPSPREIARMALVHHLHSHPQLAPAVLDRCYSLDARLASGYFQVGLTGWQCAAAPCDSGNAEFFFF